MSIPIETACLTELVEQNLPFIIRTVSTMTGRYVSVQQDEEFSIALRAFAEAVERFDETRGSFLPYAALVMRSRLMTYLEQERRRQREELSLEAMEEAGTELADQKTQESDLRMEIRIYREELQKFGLTLEELADHAPSHRDTRRCAIAAAERAAGEEAIVRRTYEKKKLPVRAVAVLCGLSEKVVKTSRVFILGTMVVFVKQLTGMIQWIQEVR